MIRERSLPQSPELAGGAGFTFENMVTVRYLAARLTERVAPGADGVVINVALQQRDFGEPLDDVIVDLQTASGSTVRLSLQCKTSIVISSAAGNAYFRPLTHSRHFGGHGRSSERRAADK